MHYVPCAESLPFSGSFTKLHATAEPKSDGDQEALSGSFTQLAGNEVPPELNTGIVNVLLLVVNDYVFVFDVNLNCIGAGRF
jgi:hypothetical protein